MEALHGDEGVLFATTNYDRTLETGLSEHGVVVNDGFNVGSGLETPRLTPEGLARWASEEDPSVSVLHLHGAVGWYADDQGEILGHYPDQPFNPTLGIPAILPPDPNKDPISSGYVRAIWTEFRKALSEATHVLVIGHSLHDVALVTAMRDMAPNAHFAVSYHDQPHTSDVAGNVPLPSDRQARSAVGLNKAHQFKLDFSEEADMGSVGDWLEAVGAG